MRLCFILIFLLGMTFCHGYVQKETGEDDDVVAPKLGTHEKNHEKIKKFLQGIDPNQADDLIIESVEIGSSRREESDVSSEELLKDMESKFTVALMRLLEGDELYRDARFTALMDALRTALYTISGNIDHEYIQEVIRTVLKWDEQKRRQFDEVAFNSMDMSPTDIADFVDGLVEGMEKSKAFMARTTKSPRNSRKSSVISPKK